MIYGRFHDPITIIRVGTLQDVRKLDRRVPDKVDRSAVRAGSYVVVKQLETGDERLYHLGFIRADGGLPEIMDACRALPDWKEKR